MPTYASRGPALLACSRCNTLDSERNYSGEPMNSDFLKFVVESTRLHEQALTDQIKISEDANKYSAWFLGIATAGVAVLIARFDLIIEQTWMLEIYSPYFLIVAGVTFLGSLLLGVLHHYLSMLEISQLRVIITLFGAQRLIPFFNHPDYPKEVPAEMHIKISNGALLNPKQIDKLNSCRVKSKEYRRWQEKALLNQQILAGFGYVILFLISVHL